MLHYFPFFCCHSNQKVGVTGSSPKMVISILAYISKIMDADSIVSILFMSHMVFTAYKYLFLIKIVNFVKQILSLAFYSSLKNFNDTPFSRVSWYRAMQTGSHFLNFQHYDHASPVPKQGNANNDMLISLDGTLFAQYALCHNFTSQ